MLIRLEFIGANIQSRLYSAKQEHHRDQHPELMGKRHEAKESRDSKHHHCKGGMTLDSVEQPTTQSSADHIPQRYAREEIADFAQHGSCLRCEPGQIGSSCSKTEPESDIRHIIGNRCRSMPP